MSEIADKLIDWYGVNGRDLPWRRTRDPYRIWLSEVILQQTRIAQGMDYYLRFVARFPDVGALAAADEDEVLKLWQGLGYYSRARNLHAAARQVVERYGSGCQRQAFVPQRAVVAGGVGGRALQRAEIHDRLVVACRPTPVELFVGKRGERFAALGGVDGQIEVEEP